MPKTICYVNRYPLAQYHSIEELFRSVQSQVEQQYPTQWITLPQSGARLNRLWANLCSLRPQNNTVYHITGDVTYMGLVLGSQALMTVHDVKSALQGSWLKRWLIKKLWFQWPAKRVRYITVISEFTKSELLALIPQQAHKIKVIYNPVKPQLQPTPLPQNNLPKVLCMGTKPNKNLEGIIQAVKDLSLELLIVGKLSTAQQTLLETHNISYTHRVNLPFEKIISCYKEADVLCFPSLYEGFGMPIIEAQAMGRPVLTSNLGAMKEVAGAGAYMVNPQDPKAIREGLLRLLNDTSYQEELIAQGLKNVKRFSLQNTVGAYIQLYEQFETP